MIGFAGRIGAGKTAAAKYLARTYGFRYLRYSQILAERLRGRRTKEALQELGWRVMSGGGQQKLNDDLIRRIRSDDDYVIDGLRHPIDHRSLRRKFGSNFLLLYIEARSGLRFSRVKRRRNLSDLKEFNKIDKHPVESHIPTLRAKAYSVIQNKSDIREFHRRLDREIVAVREDPRP